MIKRIFDKENSSLVKKVARRVKEGISKTVKEARTLQSLRGEWKSGESW